jgi:hypothetical protein
MIPELNWNLTPITLACAVPRLLVPELDWNATPITPGMPYLVTEATQFPLGGL